MINKRISIKVWPQDFYAESELKTWVSIGTKWTRKATGSQNASTFWQGKFINVIYLFEYIAKSANRLVIFLYLPKKKKNYVLNIFVKEMVKAREDLWLRKMFFFSLPLFE